MTEEFLHFVWKYRLFSHKSMTTADGDPVVILSPGTYTGDAGPDFTNAKLRIAGTLWMGNVEIHLCSSDWDKHKHAGDKAYNNVILHVVYDHDKEVYRNDGTRLPVLVIRDRIRPGLESRYLDLIQNSSWISCEKHIAMIDEVYVRSALSRALTARLEEKNEAVTKLLDEYKGSWNDVFYVLLARSFGLKVNAVPFELLARSLPQQILARHKNSPEQIEALLFGQAGFLGEGTDDHYIVSLRNEYKYLRKKYNLIPLEPFLWKFLRLRPLNFPTLRIAQFAALVQRSDHLFARIVEMSPKLLFSLFDDLPVNSYWETHYRPGVSVKAIACRPGKSSVKSIVLNAVITTLFAYGKYTGRRELIERSVDLLECTSAETNQIVSKFIALGVSPRNAADSQALLQLKKEWCDKKKCLFCTVGLKIVNFE